MLQTERLHAMISAPLASKARHAARSRGMSLSEFVRDAMRRSLEAA